jgi:hypothetical protein
MLQKVNATFLLSGWTPPGASGQEQQHVVRVVEAPGLETAKATLSVVTAMHVYSVQPGMPKDPADLFNADYAQTEELFRKLVAAGAAASADDTNPLANNLLNAVQGLGVRRDPALIAAANPAAAMAAAAPPAPAAAKHALHKPAPAAAATPAAKASASTAPPPPAAGAAPAAPAKTAAAAAAATAIGGSALSKMWAQAPSKKANAPAPPPASAPASAPAPVKKADSGASKKLAGEKAMGEAVEGTEGKAAEGSRGQAVEKTEGRLAEEKTKGKAVRMKKAKDASDADDGDGDGDVVPGQQAKRRKVGMEGGGEVVGSGPSTSTQGCTVAPTPNMRMQCHRTLPSRFATPPPPFSPPLFTRPHPRWCWATATARAMWT